MTMMGYGEYSSQPRWGLDHGPSGDETLRTFVARPLGGTSMAGMPNTGFGYVRPREVPAVIDSLDRPDAK